jgi:trk system potassium uptake protein
MRIVIAGCGRVGSQLAVWLSGDGHDVTVIDKRESTLRSLGRGFNGVYLVGEAYDVSVLREAGLDEADVFLAVTDSDNANLMAAEVAARVFDVPRSIARLYDPNREGAYQALNVQFVTGTKIIASVVYEQVVNEEFRFHTTFTGGDVEIVEFALGPDAAGLEVAALEIEGRLRVATVIRDGATIIPGAGFVLAPDDLVVGAARHGVRSDIAPYLKASTP